MISVSVEVVCVLVRVRVQEIACVRACVRACGRARPLPPKHPHTNTCMHACTAQDFTFDEDSSPHMSLEEDGKKLTSLFKELEEEQQRKDELQARLGGRNGRHNGQHGPGGAEATDAQVGGGAAGAEQASQSQVSGGGDGGGGSDEAGGASARLGTPTLLHMKRLDFKHDAVRQGSSATAVAAQAKAKPSSGGGSSGPPAATLGSVTAGVGEITLEIASGGSVDVQVVNVQPGSIGATNTDMGL